MRHFSGRGYRPTEVDLNGYQRISNPYCCDIQIQRCWLPQGYQMAKGKGVGQGLGQKDGTRVKGQWGGVGPWGKGEQGLGSWGDSDITQKYS